MLYENKLSGRVIASPNATFRLCYLDSNPGLECPFPSGCENCSCDQQLMPACESKCLYPGVWTPCIPVIFVSTAFVYSSPVTGSDFVQNPGVVLTLSGHALLGVAITGQSVSLSGDLVLDISALDVYDGMTFTLINATTITGQWQSVTLSGSTSECILYNVDVTYSTGQAVATITMVPLCASASKTAALYLAVMV
jgi:hypothetical protein